MLLLTRFSAVLAVLLLGVSVSSAASKIPTLLPPRQASTAISMATIVSDLQAVVTANTNTTNTAIASTYLAAIETHATTLTSSSLVASTASQASSAGLVCKLSQLLFGADVVTPNESTYTSKEQENW
jgi:hypothetical protein